MESFPINANGKLDRKSLLPPDKDVLRVSYAAPETEVEKKLCQAFSSVLHINSIGLDDDFFLLGGDSIKVMLLQKACKELSLSSKMIFSARTPRILARLCNDQKEVVLAHKDCYPLSQTQMGIYVECMKHKGEAIYNNPRLYRLATSVDVDRVKTAIEATVAAHPYLLTRISLGQDEEPLQKRVAEPVDYKVTVERLTEMDMESLRPVLVQPFDLLTDPLFRIRLLQTERCSYLFFDFHHIIFDGSSFDIMVKDFNRAYMGEPLEKETYSGFEVAQEEELVRQSHIYIADKQWYNETFASMDVDSLPLPDVKEDTVRYAKTACRVPCFDELNQLCHQQGVTMNVLSLAAFGYLLGIYMNSEESLFATIYNGRSDLKTNNTLAMMVKTLPVYCSWTSETSLHDYLQNVKQLVLGTMQHDSYSFAELCGENHTISSQVLFAYQGDLHINEQLFGASYEEIPLLENATGEKLTVQLFLRRDHLLELVAEYQSNLYSSQFIDAFLKCYLKVLHEFLTKAKMGDIDILPDSLVAELDAFNSTAVEYDASQTIVSLFRQTVKLHPDQVAVAQNDEVWTYSQVDQLSDKLASYVHRLGIGRGDVVSILIPRCPYMVTASVGVLKSCCCYQPLDPTYPSERLNFMMKDAQAALLVTTRELRSKVDEYEGKVIYLDELSALPAPAEALEDPLPTDSFTLLYTSGTTGLPKGCVLQHANLVCFCHWYHRAFHLTADSCVGAYASYGFDANMMDMYSAITIGATCVIVGEEIRLDLPVLSEYLAQHHVTHMLMTTQVGRQFVCDYPAHPTLKYLLVGGEKLVPVTPPSNYQLINAYGPTECTIITTYYPVRELEDDVPIGKPLDNFRLYIVDKNNHRLPIGALGELRMAGPQVSIGYLNRPEATEKVFIRNTFTADLNYRRMYCSGDIVRYKQDGNIEFIGRRDAQVKIRGFRIELTEVEAVVRSYPGITDATVAAFDDPNGGKFIAAYVVSEATVDVKALNAFIAEQKPPYMIPAVTMQIDKIPLNQNMKVNKRALPEPKLNVATEVEEERIPNLLEEELLLIIGSILRLEKFPFTAELTFLGLTSILSIKLAAAVFKRFGVSIPSKFLMHGATLLRIENEIIHHWMQGESPSMAHQQDTSVQSSELPAFAPLSYSQQGVYYDCMKRPTEVVYNIPAMLTFDPSLDPDELEAAVRTVLAAHPSVMAHFEMQQQEVVEFHDDFEIQIDRIQLSDEELDGYKKNFVRPFNLSKAPLFRLSIVQTTTRVVLFTDFHHLIFDGASFDLFVQHLKQVLEGKTLDVESYGYLQYATDEREEETKQGFIDNRNFFHDMLCHCDSASEIPSDRPGSKAEEGVMGEIVRQLDGEALYEYCKIHQLTPAAICLAAAFYTCSRYTNSKEVYISTISNGRSDLRTMDTFGMFVKTLPLGITIAEQTVEEFVAQTGRLLADTVEHESYPFSRISTEYNYTPQIMYACQLGVMEEIEVNGKPVGFEGLEPKIAKFKLAIHIDTVGDAPAIVLQYNDAVYTKELMESFATSMYIVLQQMMAHPALLVKRLTLLNEERQIQVASFRETGEAHVGLYHQALERHAASIPEHTALIAVDGTYTYSLLNAQANRIAHALMVRGVKKGDRVALLLPRTSRVILSMFGVMKAGAAYIPCDPEYPVERINHILSDSEAAYIITTADRLGDFPVGKAIDVEELLLNDDETNPVSGVTPADLVYLIYTSGSTGKPKGVMLHHGGICNYLTADPRNVHVYALVREASVFLSVTTVSFDMSLKEIGTTLYNGLTLVFADEQQANNPILLAELFSRTGADAFNATPSRMMQYIELPEFRESLSRCKVIMCGGEKYPDQLLTRLRAITSSRIFNTYGPTEITVSSNGKDLTSSNLVTIGKPLANYLEFIVDADGNELPPHVIGELYIGGIGVARGYQQLPQMTAERFIDYKGVHVYKSGDYARWTDEGEVVILGRCDTQVKLRGLRIELGEVESTLLKYPGIRSAVVLIRNINGTEHLCAYFTAEAKVDIELLKDTLKVTLTQYMVPTAYLQLDAIPLTPNGKTDVKALPEPQLLTATANEAPANETERLFCEIFAGILHMEKVGATDNYFELGGTSLSVASIIIEANKSGLRVAYGDVFANPTPRGLASLFSEVSETNEEDTEITDYDYSSLQPVLDANTLDALRQGECQPIGNVLLTGGTGFLGVHILHTLLTQETGKIYLLLRSKGDMTAEDRLKTVLYYYFENAYDELFGKRLFVVNGDVTRPETLRPLETVAIDTVFNCAANVKHFAAGDEIERVNVGGVKTLLGFCKKTGARLVHVSTMSIGGLIQPDHANYIVGLRENELYFNQSLDNKYIRSKFLAERLILETILHEGVSAKIMRVGNLSARSTDGEFQINFSTNTFMGRLKSYNIIHKCAYDVLDSPLEFSPIDEVAKAIVALSVTPKECCIFHPYNHHFVLLGDVLNLMSKMGMRIEPVETGEFVTALAEAEADPEKAKILSSMIAYQNMGAQDAVPTKKNNTFTMQVLYRLGYRWPITSWDYINRLLNFMKGMGFFDEGM